MTVELLTEERLAADSVGLMSVLLSEHPDVKAVVGVPRSGMIPASIIAASSGLMLGTLDSNNEVMWTGRGRRGRQIPKEIRPGDKVAVVDDSVNTGASMDRVIHSLRPEILRQRHCPLADAEIVYASVYCTEQAREHVDLHAVDLEMPHFFTWHLFGSGMSSKFGFDMDGVLCEDHPPMDDYDTQWSVNWLDVVKPKRLVRPSRPRAIITARCHIYREQTERWLAKHGVKPGELIMGPWDSGKERAKHSVVQWKADQIKRLGLRYFVESDVRQAIRIHTLAGVTVICTDSCEVFIP